MFSLLLVQVCVVSLSVVTLVQRSILVNFWSSLYRVSGDLINPGSKSFTTVRVCWPLVSNMDSEEKGEEAAWGRSWFCQPVLVQIIVE